MHFEATLAQPRSVFRDRPPTNHSNDGSFFNVIECNKRRATTFDETCVEMFCRSISEQCSFYRYACSDGVPHVLGVGHPDQAAPPSNQPP